MNAQILNDFVEEVVNKWLASKERKKFLSESSLSGTPKSNKDKGTSAEVYVSRKFDGLNRYHACNTPRSHSKADVVVIKHHSYFWHIMLLQVKSSIKRGKVKNISSVNRKEFKVFAKYFSNQRIKTKLLKTHKTKDYLISTGKVDVFNYKKDGKHKIQNVEDLKFYCKEGKEVIPKVNEGSILKFKDYVCFKSIEEDYEFLKSIE